MIRHVTFGYLIHDELLLTLKLLPTMTIEKYCGAWNVHIYIIHTAGHRRDRA